MNESVKSSADHKPIDSEFISDVLKGLTAQQKWLPCRWLYDERGSELFEAITHLPEYYLTRTETKILKHVAPQLANAIGSEAELIEYGAGASTKTRILLDNLPRLRSYVPIDVSETFLLQTAETLRVDYPDLTVRPVVADFLSPLYLPEYGPGRRVGFFPGSTIGNLSNEEIEQFLTQARQNLGPESLFILGYDRVKPLSILIPAYDDAAGVTAAFNLNLLQRINRELGADFDVSEFCHEARWNDALFQIEMHLVSKRSQTVRIGEQTVSFSSGETIHTENSRKFTPDQINRLAALSGYRVRETYSDADDLFSVALLERSGSEPL